MGPWNRKIFLLCGQNVFCVYVWAHALVHAYAKALISDCVCKHLLFPIRWFRHLLFPIFRLRLMKRIHFSAYIGHDIRILWKSMRNTTNPCQTQQNDWIIVCMHPSVKKAHRGLFYKAQNTTKALKKSMENTTKHIEKHNKQHTAMTILLDFVSHFPIFFSSY